MPERKGQRLRITALLSVLWGYYPDERLGQLLVNTLGERDDFYLTDDQFEQLLLDEIEAARSEGLDWRSSDQE